MLWEHWTRQWTRLSRTPTKLNCHHHFRTTVPTLTADCPIHPWQKVLPGNADADKIKAPLEGLYSQLSVEWQKAWDHQLEKAKIFGKLPLTPPFIGELCLSVPDADHVHPGFPACHLDQPWKCNVPMRMSGKSTSCSPTQGWKAGQLSSATSSFEVIPLHNLVKDQFKHSIAMSQPLYTHSNTDIRERQSRMNSLDRLSRGTQGNQGTCPETSKEGREEASLALSLACMIDIGSPSWTKMPRTAVLRFLKVALQLDMKCLVMASI